MDHYRGSASHRHLSARGKLLHGLRLRAMLNESRSRKNFTITPPQSNICCMETCSDRNLSIYAIYALNVSISSTGNFPVDRQG